MSEALGPPAQPESDGTPGALLKRERERRALSIQQAAEDLHLDPWVIEAIEANRFQALGAPVYAKGHLRKYATSLELPADELIQKYEALHDRPVTADPIPMAIAAPLPPPRRSFKGPILILLSLLVAIVLGWAAVQLFAAQPTAVATQGAVLASTAQPDTEIPPSVRTAETPGEETPGGETPGGQAFGEPTPGGNSVPAVVQPAEGAATALSLAATQNAPAASVANQGPTDAEPIQVRLQFSGDSWTEIYDARGARLMFAMGSEGRTRTLTGVPPLQVTLGSVSAVSLEVNGEAVAIPREEGRESSRFVIEASGNLR
jgi:cytoskeleton protein RodZ